MIGIYGGTFDPVHFGHLRPALDVLEALQLKQVRFIPCGQPPHRQSPHADAKQRSQMLHLAIDAHADFVVDEREIQRSGPSYMIDTLRSLKQEMPEEKFCLIIGMDAFCDFDTWKEWLQIFDLAHIVVTHRPGFVFGGSQASDALTSEVISRSVKDKQELARTDSGRILFYPVTQLDISSTKIREAVKQNRDLRFLMPDAVIKYIVCEKIYQ